MNRAFSILVVKQTIVVGNISDAFLPMITLQNCSDEKWIGHFTRILGF